MGLQKSTYSQVASKPMKFDFNPTKIESKRKDSSIDKRTSVSSGNQIDELMQIMKSDDDSDSDGDSDELNKKFLEKMKNSHRTKFAIDDDSDDEIDYEIALQKSSNLLKPKPSSSEDFLQQQKLKKKAELKQLNILEIIH